MTDSIPPFPIAYPTMTVVDEYLDNGGGIVLAFEVNGALVGYRVTYTDARTIRAALAEKLNHG